MLGNVCRPREFFLLPFFDLYLILFAMPVSFDCNLPYRLESIAIYILSCIIFYLCIAVNSIQFLYMWLIFETIFSYTVSAFLTFEKNVIFMCYFLRRAHSTDHPS